MEIIQLTCLHFFPQTMKNLRYKRLKYDFITTALNLSAVQKLDNCRTSIIRPFACNTKRPSVKQSIKRQVCSNFQTRCTPRRDTPLGFSDDLSSVENLVLCFSDEVYPKTRLGPLFFRQGVP